jgi:hypothetical protein
MDGLEAFDLWDDSPDSDLEGSDEWSEDELSTGKRNATKSIWEKEPFVYPSLNLDRPAFRLLRLHQGTGPEISCNLFNRWLDRHISYEAVSYTWALRIS